jgi:hypothetical protein
MSTRGLGGHGSVVATEAELIMVLLPDSLIQDPHHGRRTQAPAGKPHRTSGRKETL